MIKSFSIFTSEVDNVNIAIADLKEQLSQITLLKNSVGIVACHYDYINTGIVSALNETMPFTLIGFTTFYQRNTKTQGLFELTITILTSDEASFVITENSSQSEKSQAEKLIEDTYINACGDKGRPACIFNFLSANRPISGDEYIRIINDVSGGVPIFGGITTSDTDIGQNMFVISNGQTFEYGFAMLLIYGDVKPKFHYINYDENHFIDMPGTVTKTEGEGILEINKRPVNDFMCRRGIDLENDAISGLLTIPFLFKRRSGSPYIARVAYDFDESKVLKLFGEVPEGAIFRVGTANPNSIVENAETIVKRAVADAPDANVFFMLSCIGRYIALGMRQGSEFENIKNIMPENATYLAAYVGGELCPIVDGGIRKNEFHNSSLVVCTLE